MSSTQTPVERTADVHVTGRRVIATLINSPLLGGLYVSVALASGHSSSWLNRRDGFRDLMH